MRFYEGYIYDVNCAVYPEQKGIWYQVLDVRDDKKHKPAYIKLGYDRELKVKDNAKLIWAENKKDKVVSIPFTQEDGRLVFDLPAYLKERKVKFKLYKRLTNCAGDSWDMIAYLATVSSAGMICWGDDWCMDYREYWMNVTYQKNYPELDGKRVKQFRFDRNTSHLDTGEILSWFKGTLEHRKKLSYEEVGELIDRWGLRKESPFNEIRFCDGSSITGDKIWEMNQ